MKIFVGLIVFWVGDEIEDNSMAKHVHQSHNNVSIKIELVTYAVPSG